MSDTITIGLNEIAGYLKRARSESNLTGVDFMRALCEIAVEEHESDRITKSDVVLLLQDGFGIGGLTVKKFSDVYHAWTYLLSCALKGRGEKPRGRPCLSAGPVALTFAAKDLVMHHPIRAFGYRLMARELYWYTRRGSDPGYLLLAHPGAMSLWEPTAYHYGARMGEQWEPLLRLISDDPRTRRAMLHIGYPAAHTNDSGGEVACIDSLTFMPYPESKEMDVTIFARSNDLWHGYPGDMHSLGTMAAGFARVTGHNLRRIHYICVNPHLYTKHVEMAREVVGSPLAGRAYEGLRFRCPEDDVVALEASVASTNSEAFKALTGVTL